MKEISYYELLKMVKDGNIPKKVNYKITGYLQNYVEYTAQYDRNDFTHYELTNRNREDENIHFYLNENYLESDMFDESILIEEEEEKEIPEKLEYEESDENGDFSINGFTFDFEQKIQIIKTVNEIIDFLKSKGDE